MSNLSSILVGSANGTVWMKLVGRGTFENCQGLKEFSRRMIQRGHRDFVLDLEKCELMDSTFMGTLAALAFNLRETREGGLRVVRANRRNFSLLESLGLDHLFSVEPEPADPAPQSLQASGVPEAPAELTKADILVAHEALVEADPRNAVRFQDVIEYLRQELAEGTSETPA
ncbi:MAG: STAS domain-containing protein [Verrucomicrobiota bacterium]